MPTVMEKVESYYRSVLDQLESGARLPSERSVMAELETCRSTVRLVLTKLKAEERLYPIHGSGYYKA